MKRRKRLLSAVGCTFIFFCFALFLVLPARPADNPTPLTPVIVTPSHYDVSIPLGSIRPISPSIAAEVGVREIFLGRPKITLPLTKAPFMDLLTQGWFGKAPMPPPITSFEGSSSADNTSILGFGVYPPDTNGDVGPNHYVQWVNLLFQIWDKNGNSLYGPAAGNTLWSGFGGACETSNDGDPIVLYDHLADRWFLTQFALPNFPNGPFSQCIAVSTTGDPTGSYTRYEYQFADLNDYGKFGVWPDGYYGSFNMFYAGSLVGKSVIASAFDRDAMLAGQPAAMILFDLSSISPSLWGFLPSDLDGQAPPAGSPNYFVKSDDSILFPSDTLAVYGFHVDWTTPANSTFTPGPALAPAAFDSNMCDYSENCIPQPGTTVKLDALSDRLMYRLQYRNFGDHEGMVVNQTVDADGTDHAGIRWYELRKTTGDWSIYQEGTYAPDADHRFMGSMAMDMVGNIALGFSVSSSTVFPSIRYVGRLVTDPLGTLPQTETTMISGTGSQTGSAGRWGDYSAMSVDPTDECTFWYTQEYMATTGPAPWQTRIGSFKFDGCGPCIDNDGDGYGDPGSLLCTHPERDCDDTNPNVSPGATEGPFGDPTCSDGLDNNCDGLTDSSDTGCVAAQCVDNDGDGYGSPASPTCTHPELDCNDMNPNIHPGAVEVCDGADNNCDGNVDEEPAATQSCNDLNVCTNDACSAGNCVYTPNSAPCDDGNACTIGDVCSGGGCIGGPPPECDDGNGCTNDSCNPVTGACVYTNNTAPCDDGNACTMNDTCSGGACAGAPVDADGDGHMSTLCGGDDCDDSNAAVYPGAAEVCDGIDNQCTGNPGFCKIDEGCPFVLVSPANGAAVTVPPTLQWTAGDYDLFRVILTLPILGVNWTVQLPWMVCTSVDLSFLPKFSFSWQYVTPNKWASWSVVAVNSKTLKFKVLGPYTFRRT